MKLSLSNTVCLPSRLQKFPLVSHCESSRRRQESPGSRNTQSEQSSGSPGSLLQADT